MTSSQIKQVKKRKTYLDKVYDSHVFTTVSDDEDWDFYEVVIDAITKMNTKLAPEIKYRITDGEKTCDVLLDVMENKLPDGGGSLWFFKRKLTEYKEDAYYRQFFL